MPRRQSLQRSAASRHLKGVDHLPVDQLITRRQVAELGPFRESTLKTWASKRVGPPFLKIGKKVLYIRSEFEAWLADNATRHPPASPSKLRMRNWTSSG